MPVASKIILSGIMILTLAWTPYASGQSLPPGADAFVASANALAKSADERVDLGRAKARLMQIKLALTQQLLLPTPPVKSQLISLDEVKVLCDVLRQHLDVASGRNYIQAIGSQIESIGKPSQIENILDAVRTLFKSQSLDIQGPVSTKAQLDAAIKVQTERCASDIKAAAESFYGLKIAPPAASAANDEVRPEAAAEVFLGEFSTLINVFVEIVTPVIVEGAKIVDEQRRREAVRSFLAKESNRIRITAVGGKLADEIYRYTLNKRRSLAGSVLERIAAIRETEIDLSKIDACKELMAKRFETRPSGAPSDEFVNCWRHSFSKLEASVASLLKVAQEYDELADAGATDTAKKQFAELSEALQAISEGSVTNPDQLWKLATRLIAFATKIEASMSKENRAKMESAIDGLMRSL